MKLRYPAILAWAGLAWLLITAGCTPAETQSTTLRYGLTLAPSGLDPHLNASVELGIPLSSVYDTLVFQHPDSGAFVPGLARRWEISPDGRRYTFYLREDVQFHDGTHFDAHAVQANLQYIQDPDHRSQKALSLLGPLSAVRVLDDYTVALELAEPFAPLLDSLSQVYLGMASPAALERWGPTEYQYHQVGSGPFRFVEYLPNDHLTLERNPDYTWAPRIYHNRRAQVERIVFRFYEDLATRALALEGGEVDIIGELPALEADRLGQDPDFRIYPVAIPGQPMQFLFNTQLAPTDDPQVRQALVLALDRASIVRTVFGEYSPVAGGPLAAVTPGYAAQAAFPEFDLSAAMALLERAGWTAEGVDGRRSKLGVPLRLKLVAPDWGSNPEVAQLLASAWEGLGAQVEIEVAAGFGLLTQAQSAGDYHVIGMNSFGSDPDVLRPFYHSEGFFNWSNYREPELDALLQHAAASFESTATRMDLYAQVAQVIRDEWLILPVRDYVNLIGTVDQVRDLRFSPQGWFPYLIDVAISP